MGCFGRYRPCMDIGALYPGAVVAVLTLMLFLIARGVRSATDGPDEKSYMTSRWAVWAQVFVIGWSSLSAWAWWSRDNAGWWLWALAAAVAIATLGVLLANRRREGARSEVDADPGPALPLAIGGGIALLSAGLVRGLAGGPGGEGFGALDVAYIIIVGISLALFVAAGFAAFRRTMARQDRERT